jgi:hydrogenase nickel incorporation protein HypA/HybF
MHELSIASSIVESVLKFAEEQGAKKIVEVRLAVGELTCVEAEQLRFCFTAITKETALEDATLEIETIPALVRCPHCAYEGRPKYWDDALSVAPIATLQCPTCGKAAEATEGHDCAIRTVKYAA